MIEIHNLTALRRPLSRVIKGGSHMKLQILGIGSVLIASAASPISAQNGTDNKALGEQLTACVNKAIAENPGPDFTSRYIEVEKCQKSTSYKYDQNNTPINIQDNNDYRTMKLNAEQKIRSILIDPESAKFEWPYGFLYSYWKPFLRKRVTGHITCGFVNSRNRMGGYAGRAPFVVVMDGGSVSFVEIDDDRGLGLVGASCQNYAKNFPPPQKGMLEENVAEELVQPSVADEIQKLDNLRQKGILSEEEFRRQKDKILGN